MLKIAELTKGDIIRVTTEAHSRRKNLASREIIEVPQKTMVLQVICTGQVAGQPERKRADCFVLVDEAGKSMSDVAEWARPTITIMEHRAGLPVQTIERA